MNIKEIPNEDIDFFKSIFSSKKDSIQDDIIFRIKYIIHLSHCFLLQHPTKEDFLETLFSQICDSIDIKIENSPKDFVFYTISKKDSADTSLSKSIIDHANKIELTSYVSTPNVNKDGLYVFSDFTLKNCIPVCFLTMNKNQLIESIYDLVCKYFEVNLNWYKKNLDSIHVYKEKFYIAEKELDKQISSFSKEKESLYYYDEQMKQVKIIDQSQKQDFYYLYLEYNQELEQWNVLENSEIFPENKTPLCDHPGISFRYNKYSKKWELVSYFYNSKENKWIKYDIIYKYYIKEKNKLCNIPDYPFLPNMKKEELFEIKPFTNYINLLNNIIYNKITKTWETRRQEFNTSHWVDMEFPYLYFNEQPNEIHIYNKNGSTFTKFATNNLLCHDNKISKNQKNEDININSKYPPQTTDDEKHGKTILPKPYRDNCIDMD